MENGRGAQVSNFSLELSEQEAPVRGIPATLSPPPSLAVSLLINGVGWGRKRRTIINIDGSADLFLIMCFASVLIGMETVTWLERPGASWGLSFFLSLPLFSFLFGWSLTWWEWRGQRVRNIKPNLRGCSQAGERRGVMYWGVHGMWGQGGLEAWIGKSGINASRAQNLAAQRSWGQVWEGRGSSSPGLVWWWGIRWLFWVSQGKLRDKRSTPRASWWPVPTLLCYKRACSGRQLLSARDFNLK